jgi:TM2 domain-containing membrane protein YozV
LIPGLGQIYNGQILKGILMLIAYVVMWLLFFLVVPLVIALIIWIYGIYDAYKTAQKINAEGSRMGNPQYPGY